MVAHKQGAHLSQELRHREEDPIREQLEYHRGRNDSSFLSLCSSWMVQMREVGSDDAFGQYVVDNGVNLGTDDIGKNSVGSKE